MRPRDLAAGHGREASGSSGAGERRRGEPLVSNGLSLCKIHHAAFDLHILGIRPDLVVEIRADILRETDGPMLRHGLQEMSGVRLEVPRAAENRPRQDYLEERYALFTKAG